MSKKNKPFIPPPLALEMPSQEVLARLQKMTKKENKQFTKSLAYKKYVQPIEEGEKRQKREKRKEWWLKNWISIAALVLSLISLLVTIISELQ